MSPALISLRASPYQMLPGYPASHRPPAARIRAACHDRLRWLDNPSLPYTGLGPRRLYMRCAVWPGPQGLVPGYAANMSPGAQPGFPGSRCGMPGMPDYPGVPEFRRRSPSTSSSLECHGSSRRTIGTIAVNKRMSYFHEMPTRLRKSISRTTASNSRRRRRLFEAFAGFAPPQVATRRIGRTIPKVLVDMGALRGLVYTKDHWRQRSGPTSTSWTIRRGSCAMRTAGNCTCWAEAIASHIGASKVSGRRTDKRSEAIAKEVRKCADKPSFDEVMIVNPAEPGANQGVRLMRFLSSRPIRDGLLRGGARTLTATTANRTLGYYGDVSGPYGYYGEQRPRTVYYGEAPEPIRLLRPALDHGYYGKPGLRLLRPSSRAYGYYGQAPSPTATTVKRRKPSATTVKPRDIGYYGQAPSLSATTASARAHRLLRSSARALRLLRATTTGRRTAITVQAPDQPTATTARRRAFGITAKDSIRRSLAGEAPSSSRWPLDEMPG